MLEILKLIATTEGVEGGTATDNPVETLQQEPEVNTEVTQTEPVEETTPELPTEYEIDGEKYTIDDIREWRKGNLRQADYTKKTTELAKQRKEAEDALEVYNYLMSKPDLVKKLYELDVDNPEEVDKVSKKLDPVTKQINDLNQKLLIKDIEAELKEITSKDKLVNDVELLQLANEMKCPISTAYEIWKGKNLDRIVKERESQIKRQIAKQTKENADTTKTLISQADTKNESGGNFGLSDEQLKFADKIGMTPEEYAKYSKNPW